MKIHKHNHETQIIIINTYSIKKYDKKSNYSYWITFNSEKILLTFNKTGRNFFFLIFISKY
jgi:hypothetical protein